MAIQKPLLLQGLLYASVRMVHNGALKMIDQVIVKDISKVEEHFRAMQTASHIGKLVLNMTSDAPLKVQPSQPKLAVLQPDNSYLVVGGTGGLGKPIVRYLAKMGAKRIVTLSRSGSDGKGVAELIEDMKQLGAELVAVKGNVSDKSVMDHIKSITAEHPIRGVIQASMVLKDSVVNSMTHSQWRDVLEPKVVGTFNLYDAFGSSLDFFILLSSTGGIIGGHGQGNYNAANTVLDAFARHQASIGRPARTIDIGWVRGEGTVAESEDVAAFVSAQSVHSHSVEELLAIINFAIQNPIVPTPADAQILCGTRRADPSSGTEEASRQRADAKFSHIWSSPTIASVGLHKKAEDGDVDVPSALPVVATPAAATEIIYTSLQHKLARLLAISAKEIQPDRAITSYGLDSLISVELRNWIVGYLGAQVPLLELMSPMPMTRLAQVIAKRSRHIPQGIFSQG